MQDTDAPSSGWTPTNAPSKYTQSQLVEALIDPTPGSPSSITSGATQATHDPTTFAAIPIEVLPEEMMEIDTASVELSDSEDSGAAVLPNTNHDDTGNTSFVPPRIATPSQDVIRTVDGSGKVGKELWIPSTAIDAYLEMLSNHVNSGAGRAVVGVLSSAFWGWYGSRCLFFGQREASFPSGITTILVPRLASSNHWQLVLVDRKREEIQVYCSMGCQMGSKDFLVSPANVI
jgi:hypothetical protein